MCRDLWLKQLRIAGSDTRSIEDVLTGDLPRDGLQHAGSAVLRAEQSATLVDTPAGSWNSVGTFTRNAVPSTSMIDVCPICGESEEMNTEDVLPQWLRKYAMAEADGERFVGAMPSGAAYDAPSLFKVTARVGRNCNWWMGATFESPTKPLLVRLIDGDEHVIETDEQVAVAKWVGKTTLMNALAHPPSPDLSVYQRFRSDGEPPPGIRILIGHYSSPGIIPNFQASFAGPRGTSVAFLPIMAVLGRLVVVSCLPIGGPPVRTVAERNGDLVRIWPLTGRRVAWPPPGLDSSTAVTASSWELAPTT